MESGVEIFRAKKTTYRIHTKTPNCSTNLKIFIFANRVHMMAILMLKQDSLLHINPILLVI
jgi:hypothetical protein